uniref:Uncharacterized protein n=1 Tax=Anguilla anguilla TaxID=7936 RepID=A0A0E9Q5P9_ANGAN
MEPLIKQTDGLPLNCQSAGTPAHGGLFSMCKWTITAACVMRSSATTLI